MHNPNAYCLIVKEQAKGNSIELSENGLAQIHYSKQHIDGYGILCYKKYLQFFNH
jgi:hypothetical protein